MRKYVWELNIVCKGRVVINRGSIFEITIFLKRIFKISGILI